MKIHIGLNVQSEQILKWQRGLKPEIFAELLNVAHVKNLELSALAEQRDELIAKNPNSCLRPINGFDVWRGTDIDSWVVNRLQSV